VSPIVAEVSGALCIGAVALVSVVASSDVELSVQEAIMDVIAMIAKNFFILNIFFSVNNAANLTTKPINPAQSDLNRNFLLNEPIMTIINA
jgi:hypothetical protein